MTTAGAALDPPRPQTWQVMGGDDGLVIEGDVALVPGGLHDQWCRSAWLLASVGG